MKNILIVCTHNSCRSVMTEGLLQHYGKGKFAPYSAGSAPSGKINQKALETLKTNRIEAAYGNFKSQSWDEFADIKFDIVITVCDQAAGESCPLFFGEAIRAHWGVADPSIVTGGTAEIDAAFQATFETLKKRVISLTQLNIAKLGLAELKDKLNEIGKL